MPGRFLLYGSYGYTGRLIAEHALDLGLEPVLSGRNASQLARQAGELDLEYRAVSLDDPAALDRALEDLPFVLHCAGPFSHTHEAMAGACLRTGRHYLDITGEISVFESLASRGREASKRGVMLLPGVGFDVVPSDCLAAHLARRLPGATRLTLAFLGLNRPSRGTATTVIENLHRGGMVRKNGVLTPVPAAHQTRRFDFGGGRTTSAITIPWGDVSTAYYSTGIPDIEVYAAVPLAAQLGAKLGNVLGPLLGSSPVQNFLKARVKAGPEGPTEAQRERGFTVLYGEVENAKGEQAAARLRTPEGYVLTARTAVLIAQKVLSGGARAGFQTPSLAFGPDLILEAEGVAREDL